MRYVEFGIVIFGGILCGAVVAHNTDHPLAGVIVGVLSSLLLATFMKKLSPQAFTKRW